MITVTRVEGSNEIIIMVIYIINVRRPVSKVQDEWMNEADISIF